MFFIHNIFDIKRVDEFESLLCCTIERGRFQAIAEGEQRKRNIG